MRKGFDREWAPTDLGRRLEDLIDLVCINDDEVDTPS